MAAAEAQMARVLARARRRQGGILVATAVGWALAGVLAVVLAASLALARSPSVGVRHSALALSASLVVVAAFLLARAVLRRAGSPESVARALGDAEPAIRSDLVSAVELAAERPDIEGSGRYSLALVDAHLSRAAERAEAVNLERAFPVAPARYAATALGVMVLVWVAAFGLQGRELDAGLRRLFASGGRPAADAAAARAEPITGDVELTYRYPAYMKREPRTVSGTSGEIVAPLGTEVELRTRADRPVKSAQLVVEVQHARPQQAAPAESAAPKAPAAESAAPKTPPTNIPGAETSPAETARAAPATPDPTAPSRQVVALTVENGRDLAGRLVVVGGGSYRFQFTQGDKVMAEGPPVAITAEQDAAPEVRITAPEKEIEVEPGAKVSVAWSASDDVGLGELTLVTKRVGGAEERKVIADLGGMKRDGGVHVLDLGAIRLGAGERLAYRFEVLDSDQVSGPKRGASATQVVKVFSAAEHRRLAFDRARRLWEELVRHLGDRLEANGDARQEWTRERLEKARALDAATRTLHENVRAGAVELRRDRAAPRELAAALANVAAGIAAQEKPLSQLRDSLIAMLAFQQADSPLARRVDELDDRLVGELERSTLYLDRLLDRERASDLVRLAKELEKDRRELAEMLERYRDDPSEAARKELLARMEQMKGRMEEMLRRMAEGAEGLSDGDMREQAVAQARRGEELKAQLERTQKAMKQKGVDEALRELEAMARAMDEMKQGMERTARQPTEAQRELVEQLRQFQRDLSDVERAQEALANETGKVKARYRDEVSKRMQQMESEVKRLEGLARESLRHVEQAQGGITPRSEHDYQEARERLSSLARALQARDLAAALETARIAAPAVERLAGGLEEDVAIMERYPQAMPANPEAVKAAKRAAGDAVEPAREVRRALEQAFPDPNSVLGAESQAQLREQSQRQQQLSQQAEGLRQQLDSLSQRAPVFPPESSRELGASREHMRAASGELARGDPLRGQGEQRQALDALRRLRQGMEQNAQQGGGGGGEEFPYPMAAAQVDGGTEEGDGLQPAQEKVEIPGAEAFKPPEEFRRELLEAMKQGAPEPYRTELQRYYEEIVR